MIKFFRVDNTRRKGPRLVAVTSTAMYSPKLKPLNYIWSGGRRWTTFTAFDLSTTPPQLIRRDYAIKDLRDLGAELPPLYTDELGNIRNDQDEIVMPGPTRSEP